MHGLDPKRDEQETQLVHGGGGELYGNTHGAYDATQVVYGARGKTDQVYERLTKDPFRCGKALDRHHFGGMCLRRVCDSILSNHSRRSRGRGSGGTMAPMATPFSTGEFRMIGRARGRGGRSMPVFTHGHHAQVFGKQKVGAIFSDALAE